jgi:ribonucleotide reductase beta subunit family protein with ferritin-like domain
MYQKQLSCFWKPQEIDFSRDYEDFITLSDNEQYFIKMIIAFFASSDGIVNFNLSQRFLNDIQIMEATTCYTFQMMMESIHGEVYSLMLDNLVRQKDEKDKLFNSIETIPCIKKIADWSFKWIQSEKSFAHRVIAFAVIEGILFSGTFASIYWLKNYKSSGKLFLQGLVKSNEFISRDEGLHTLFACEIYNLLETRLDASEVFELVKEGVDISKEFMTDALPVKLIGMNSNLMNDYLEYVTDRLLVLLKYDKMFNTKNPFPFMETIGMLQKTNFFESRPTEYQSAHQQSQVSTKNTTDLFSSDDF